MNKKIISYALCLCSLVGLVSCGPSYTIGELYDKVPFEELTETTIGSETKVKDTELAKYSNDNPLKIALVTDSGTLNDHSFNESAYNGLLDFASKNGGGTVNKNNVISDGKIQAMYYQPAEGQYTTQGRYTVMKEAVTTGGAKVLVLPGYLFQGAIKLAIADEAFKNVAILALDCVKQDDAYNPYEYTENVTSVIYREEQSGFLAGYAAVSDGYRKLGFVGGMAVPAVVRFGSGWVQGAAAAAKDLNLENPVSMQYYYAGKFEATDGATAAASSWYANDNAEIIFACGGAVYQSVVQAVKSNPNKNPAWVGVDTNQHADTTLGDDVLATLKTSAMKNLRMSVEVMLASYMNEGGKWNSTFAKNVITVGAQSNMCKLPTEEEDNDPGVWGFKNYTVDQYKQLYKKLQDGEIKVNSFTGNDEYPLEEIQYNFGVDPKFLQVTFSK